MTNEELVKEYKKIYISILFAEEKKQLEDCLSILDNIWLKMTKEDQQKIISWCTNTTIKTEVASLIQRLS